MSRPAERGCRDPSPPTPPGHSRSGGTAPRGPGRSRRLGLDPALVPVLVALLALLLSSCARSPAPAETATARDDQPRPPIVLVTVEALRADAAGFLGGDPQATPHLDALAEETRNTGGWAGTGVAASSWVAPAAASLATGLGVWEHGVLHAGRAELPTGAPTLAEALHGQGYRTHAFADGFWLQPRFGWSRGFEVFRRRHRLAQVTERLAGLEDADFVWVHLRGPEPPLERFDPYFETTGVDPATLPPRLEEVDLVPWFDPQRPRDPVFRATVESLYRGAVAEADARLGAVLGAVRASGRWDDALVAVVGLHGIDLGDGERIGIGGALGRADLAVPLVVKPPRAGSEPGPSGGTGTPPPAATRRLWSTLAEAAGAPVPPAVAPPLFVAGAPDPSPRPVLSELYLGNGDNRFSLVVPTEDDALAIQLERTVAFAPTDPDHVRSWVASLGGDPGLPAPPPQRVVFARLRRAFSLALPFSGPQASSRRVRWETDGSVTPSPQPGEIDLDRLLTERWHAGLERERPPAFRWLEP